MPSQQNAPQSPRSEEQQPSLFGDLMPDASDKLLYHSILAQTELPTLGGPVLRVVQLTSSDQQALPQLARVILTDVALTQKLLRLANTAAYHTGAGGPVSTVSKGIFLLGFEQVRNIALAMMVVERFADVHTPGVRFELHRALCASVIARELARKSAWRDSEEAAVVALFRNLGRLMVAAHSENIYSRIEAAIDSGKALPARASAEAIGCSYDELGQIVLRDWQLPESVVQAVATLPNGPIAPARTRQQWLQQMASFSMLVGGWLARLDEPGAQDGIARLQARYGEALELSMEALQELLQQVRQEANMLAYTARLEPLPKPAPAPLQNASASANAASPAAAPPPEQALPAGLLMAAPAQASPAARHPSGKPMNADALLLAGVEDLAGMIAAGGIKSTVLLSQMLEILYRSLGFQFAAVCLADAKMDGMRARIAFGDHAEARMAAMRFPLSEAGKDLFSLALARDADLFVADTAEASVQALIPAWHKTLMPEARSLMILPLRVQGRAFGLIYGQRGVVAAEGLSSNESALVHTLKIQLLRVLQRPGTH